MTRRTRSFWGWGWADRFPDKEARAQLGQMVHAMLGFGPTASLEPARLDALALRAPRIEAPETLQDVLTTTDGERARHTYGRAYPDIVRGFHGDFAGPPDLVAHPQSEEDVRRILEWSAESNVAVVPYGGGTSVVGGVNTEIADGGRTGVLSLDMRGMNRVREIDTVSQVACIEAGALGPELEDQLRPHGLTLRHYPQSFEFSTLGGWVATRAGGHFATLYTHIDDLVESTRMLTPRGPMETRRLPGSGAGPSPDRLVLGSEGALGVITEAWLRVRPRPIHRARANVRFTSYEEAVEACRQISQAALYPSNCRLLDKREAMLNQVVEEPCHVLLLAFESAVRSVEVPLRQAMEIALDCGGECPDGARITEESEQERRDEAGQWRQAFFEGPYLQSTLVSLGILAETFETACLWSRFEAMHQEIVSGMRDAMERVTGSRGFISCRFTHVYPDGPAPYYTFLAPARVGSELSQWRELKAAASDILMKHRATITHHHAVGRNHMPWYVDSQRPPLFGDALRSVKQALDPEGIMNPGVLIETDHS